MPESRRPPLRSRSHFETHGHLSTCLSLRDLAFSTAVLFCRSLRVSDSVIRCLMCGSFRQFFCVSHPERLSLFLTSHLSVLMDYAFLTTGFKTKQKNERKKTNKSSQYASIIWNIQALTGL